MVNYLFFRGISPLIVASLVSNFLFGLNDSPVIFICIGIFSGIFFFVIYCIPKFINVTFKETIYE